MGLCHILKDSQLVRNMELWGILIETFATLNENLKIEIYRGSVYLSKKKGRGP